MCVCSYLDVRVCVRRQSFKIQSSAHMYIYNIHTDTPKETEVESRLE